MCSVNFTILIICTAGYTVIFFLLLFRNFIPFIYKCFKGVICTGIIRVKRNEKVSSAHFYSIVCGYMLALIFLININNVKKIIFFQKSVDNILCIIFTAVIYNYPFKAFIGLFFQTFKNSWKSFCTII